MATEEKNVEKEISVEERLKALYALQKVTTEIDKIKGDNVIAEYDTLSEIGSVIQALDHSTSALNNVCISLDTRTKTLESTTTNNVTNITKLENDVASINKTITTLNNEKIKSATIKGIEILDSLPSKQEEGVLYIVNGEIL